MKPPKWTPSAGYGVDIHEVRLIVATPNYGSNLPVDVLSEILNLIDGVELNVIDYDATRLELTERHEPLSHPAKKPTKP